MIKGKIKNQNFIYRNGHFSFNTPPRPHKQDQVTNIESYPIDLEKNPCLAPFPSKKHEGKLTEPVTEEKQEVEDISLSCFIYCFFNSLLRNSFILFNTSANCTPSCSFKHHFWWKQHFWLANMSMWYLCTPTDIMSEIRSQCHRNSVVRSSGFFSDGWCL